MDETNLVSLMHDATATPPPTRSIDLARAKAEGARARKRRLAGATVVSGVAALAVLGTSAAVLHTVAGQTHPTATGTGAPAANGFDPLRLHIAADWLPAGLSDVSRQVTDVDYQALSYSKNVPEPLIDPAPPSGSQGVDITVYAPDVNEGTRGSAVPVSAHVPGAIIGSTESMWFPAESELVWQWAPDAWATVQLFGDFGFAPGDIAARVANGLRTDLNEPVILPFTVAAPPAPLRLVSSLVVRLTYGTYMTSLLFSDPEDSTADTPTLQVSVETNSSISGSDKIGYPNTTVDGHPTIVSFDADPGHVLMMGVHGTWVELYVYGPATMALVNQADAIELARGVQVLSASSDPLFWTTTPIR